MAGISEGTLPDGYRQWVARLYKHNSTTREAKLQAAWTRMQYAGVVWSLAKFAEEAEIGFETFRKNYLDWINRIKAEATKRDREIVQRLDQILEEAHQEQAFLIPSEAAKKAGIEYYTLKNHYPNILKRILEYNEMTFKPRIEDRWREVIASGKCPTLVEFAQSCGLQHYAILQRYFPEVVEQWHVLKGKKGGN